MGTLFRELRFSLRTLGKEPGSAIITVLTLALGIGLCTTTFSLVYGVFFRGLDVPQPEQLRHVYRTNPSRDIDFMGVTEYDLYDWREQQTMFAGLASFSSGTVNVSGTEGPERYEGLFVSANLFDVLRVQPILGTTFRTEDDDAGAPLTVVVGYEMWNTRFEADSSVIGQVIKVNGEQATILGVMPEGFMYSSDQELWVARRDERAESPDRSSANRFNVLARIRDGITPEQAEVELATIADRLAQEYPESNEGVGIVFRTVVEDDTGPELVAVFGAMQVATIFVLLIACANVANLLLARATLRTKEAAVRTALGASRLRVVLPFFTETAVLAGAGALIGTAIAFVGVGLFDQATSGVGKPYYMEFALDLPVLAFVVAITAFTALVAGAAPALQILKTDIRSTLQDEARGSTGVLGKRLSRVLVVAEIALSCALLVGAGLMTKSIVKLRNFDFPFATENVFTARLGLFETEYPDSTSRNQFFTGLLERLQAMPGAQAAALTTSLPGSGSGSRRITIEGETYSTDQDYPIARSARITPKFFETFEVETLSGRVFTEHDARGALPVAIVNQAFVDEHFPREDPAGRRFREGTSESTADWLTIVGVVPNLRVEGFDPGDTRRSGYYVPLTQHDARFASIAVRTDAPNPLALTNPVRQVIRGIDPDIPIYRVYTMLGSIKNATWFYYVFGTLFIVFGLAALFMASVGLYGVLAFSVSRRIKEMGIRMALGATARDVLQLVVTQGGRQIAIGLSIGLVLAFFLSRVVDILMFEVTPRDPSIFTIIVLVIAGVGLLASIVPARRATSVDPIVALRYE